MLYSPASCFNNIIEEKLDPSPPGFPLVHRIFPVLCIDVLFSCKLKLI